MDDHDAVRLARPSSQVTGYADFWHPAGRQREQHAVLVVQMDPVLGPVLTVRDELKIPARQRMEPVRHQHTSVPII